MVEWELNPQGYENDLQTFQVWIGVNGVEDISFAYDPDRMPTSPWPFVVGAENADGTAGDSLGMDVAPTGDLVVKSSEAEPGESYSYTVTVQGTSPGTHEVTSAMDSDAVLGTTVVTSAVKVARPFGKS